MLEVEERASAGVTEDVSLGNQVTPLTKVINKRG